MKRLPDRRRCGRHLDMGHAKRVGQCCDNRLRRADGAGLARPLHPEDIVLAGNVAEADIESRQIIGTWQSVIHQRAGDKLALRVEGRMFMKRLADPLRNPAMHLTFQHQRVDHRTEIIHHRIAQDIDLAGTRVHFKFDHMRTIGIGRAIGLILMPDIEGMRAIIRHQTQYQILDGDRVVGVWRREHAIGKDQFLGIAFQHLGGVRARRIKCQCRHLGDCRAEDRRHARAAGCPRRADSRIPLHHLDPVGIEPQPVGQDLGQGRTVALPVFLLPGKHKDGAILAEPHIDAAIRAAAALFEIHAKPEPAKLAARL